MTCESLTAGRGIKMWTRRLRKVCLPKWHKRYSFSSIRTKVCNCFHSSAKTLSPWDRKEEILKWKVYFAHFYSKFIESVILNVMSYFLFSRNIKLVRRCCFEKRKAKKFLNQLNLHPNLPLSLSLCVCLELTIKYEIFFIWWDNSSRDVQFLTSKWATRAVERGNVKFMILPLTPPSPPPQRNNE